MIDTSKDHARFRATYAALELLAITKDDTREHFMLDVGGGNGVHTSFFRDQGLNVDLIDISPGVPERRFVGDFLHFAPPRRYSIVWASHVLEHVLNPGAFIRHLIHCADTDGWLCISVPPAKSEMTFGHVSQWCAGLLLINLIKAGLDCRDARVLTKGYNVSVITRVKFRSDDNYASWLPKGVSVSGGYFEGHIEAINWRTNEIPRSARLAADYRDRDYCSALEQLRCNRQSGFLLCQAQDDATVRFHYYSHTLEQLVVVS